MIDYIGGKTTILSSPGLQLRTKKIKVEEKKNVVC